MFALIIKNNRFYNKLKKITLTNSEVPEQSVSPVLHKKYC